MTSQVFHHVEPSQPFMLRDILPGAAWAPFHVAPSTLAASVKAPAKEAGKTKYQTAIVLASICLEVAIPLGVLGIWQFWSHMR